MHGSSSASPIQTAAWRTSAVILVCGCLISLVGFGPRSALGFFLTPMSSDNGWGREVFALSVAMQTLLYGAAQPFSGALADRFGTIRVVIAGALLYAAGIYMMAHATTPGELYLSSGVLIGFGLSGCSFNLIISSFGKLLPESWRSFSFGLGTASGSFGQFLFSPLGVYLIQALGWRTTLEIFAGLLLLIIPLAVAVATPQQDEPAKGGAAQATGPSQNYKQALSEAFGHRSYILLVLGFFTCGFQLGFVTVHLPAYLVDRGLSAEVGAILSGWLGGRMPKRYILSFIYFARAAAVVFLITLPPSPVVTLLYGAVTGLLWLSTVPPTSGLVALMFGTRWLAMLFGIAFFSHQVGGFLGVYLGGVLFERTGSYDVVWWLGVLFGVISAIINLPIVEKPVARAAAAAA